LLVVALGILEDALKSLISLNDAELLHFFNQAHIGLIPLIVLSSKSSISLSLNPTESTNDFDLHVELGIQECSGVCERWVQNERIVQHSNFQLEIVYNALFLVPLHRRELADPLLHTFLETLSQNAGDALVQLIHPDLKI